MKQRLWSAAYLSLLLFVSFWVQYSNNCTLAKQRDFSFCLWPNSTPWLLYIYRVSLSVCLCVYVYCIYRSVNAFLYAKTLRMGVLVRSLSIHLFIHIYDKAEGRQIPRTHEKRPLAKLKNRRATISWDTQWCDFVRRKKPTTK